MTFVARLGSFDFSGYLRVGPGEGLDPYDGDGFLEPAFNEGPFGDGQPLLNVDRRNRMMAWPLYLKDSETALTNLLTNPSAELDATSWAGNVGTETISRITTDAVFGGACIQCVTPGGAVNEGPIHTSVDVTVSTTYTASIYARVTSGTATCAAYIEERTAADAFVANSVGSTVTLTTSWQRLNVTRTFGATGAKARVGVLTVTSAQAKTILADGAMLETGATASTYGDGDTAGWKWNGAAHGSTSSTLVGKDGLHELVQILNREIQNPANKPLRLQWRDDDASNTTYYDVAYARFDPDYHFRRSQHGWAAGVLRVWCSPAFGHTATYRVAASAAGTGVVVKAAIASSPIGDAPALIDGQVQIGSYVDKDGHLTGLSILPHPSYVADVPAASLLNGAGASLIGASGAAGSQVLGVLFQGTSLGSQALPAFDVALSPASHYEGRNRVLMVARANHLTGIGLRAFDGVDPIGPTAIASQYHQGYGVVDLGVWSPKVRTTNATIVLNVWAGGMPATGAMGIATNATGAHGLIVNRVIVLPEDTTTFLLDSEREPVAFDSFRNATQLLTDTYDELGNAYASYGANPAPMISATHQGLVNVAATQVSGAFVDTVVGDFRYLADVRFREDPGSTVKIEIGKADISAANETNVELAPAASSWMALSIAPNQGVASVAVPKNFIDKDVRLEFESRGLRTHAALWFAGSLIASVGASHARTSAGGKPYLIVAGSGAASPYALIRSQSIHALPSTARPARSVYHLTASGAEVQDNASVFLRDVAGEQIAQTPQAVPSSAAVAAFSMPLHGGPANDVMGVEVRVNERFQYGH